MNKSGKLAYTAVGFLTALYVYRPIIKTMWLSLIALAVIGGFIIGDYYSLKTLVLSQGDVSFTLLMMLTSGVSGLCGGMAIGIAIGEKEK